MLFVWQWTSHSVFKILLFHQHASSVVVKDWLLENKDKDKDLGSEDEDKDKDLGSEDKDKDKDLGSEDKDEDKDSNFKYWSTC